MLLRNINLGLRFLLELAALASACYWGATIRAGTGLRIAVAIVLPLVVAVVWGIFISPKATVPTGRIGRAALGLIVFLVAAWLLRDRGHGVLALTYTALAVVSSIALCVLPE